MDPEKVLKLIKEKENNSKLAQEFSSEVHKPYYGLDLIENSHEVLTTKQLTAIHDVLAKTHSELEEERKEHKATKKREKIKTLIVAIISIILTVIVEKLLDYFWSDIVAYITTIFTNM